MPQYYLWGFATGFFILTIVELIMKKNIDASYSLMWVMIGFALISRQIEKIKK